MDLGVNLRGAAINNKISRSDGIIVVDDGLFIVEIDSRFSHNLVMILKHETESKKSQFKIYTD
jgi:hypothetical protein